MKKEFALDPGSPKRLKITYPANLANAEILLDGQRIMAFSTKAEFQRGTTCKLPDGSILTVRYGPTEGVPILKGVHVIRNGAPIPGSAADPVPQWAWVFMIACALIPVISLGGALPAVISFAGVGGTLSVSRLNRWSIALRVGVCALIAIVCWSTFGMLLYTVRSVKALDNGKQAITSSAAATESTDKLIHKFGVVYYNHGYRQKAIEEIKDNLYEQCDRMQPAPCSDYLQKALQEAQNTPDIQ